MNISIPQKKRVELYLWSNFLFYKSNIWVLLIFISMYITLMVVREYKFLSFDSLGFFIAFMVFWFWIETLINMNELGGLISNHLTEFRKDYFDKKLSGLGKIFNVLGCVWFLSVLLMFKINIKYGVPSLFLAFYVMLIIKFIISGYLFNKYLNLEIDSRNISVCSKSRKKDMYVNLIRITTVFLIMMLTLLGMSIYRWVFLSLFILGTIHFSVVAFSLSNIRNVITLMKESEADNNAIISNSSSN